VAGLAWRPIQIAAHTLVGEWRGWPGGRVGLAADTANSQWGERSLCLPSHGIEAFDFVQRERAVVDADVVDISSKVRAVCYDTLQYHFVVQRNEPLRRNYDAPDS